MADDIAQLGFSIDSSQAKSAGDDLERMADQADKAKKGSEEFAKATEAMAASLASVARAQQEQTRLLEQLTQQQERVIKNTRTVSDVAADATVTVAAFGAALVALGAAATGTYRLLEFGYEQSIGKFKNNLVAATRLVGQEAREVGQIYFTAGQGFGGAERQGQLNVLGESLGVGGSQIANVQQQASGLNIDFSSRLRGIEQIEDALEGATVEGFALREELRQIGINLEEFSRSDAGELFDIAAQRGLENSIATVRSLTEAIEGTTAAGIEGRRVLRAYGVEIEGLSQEEIFTQFVAAAQGTAGGPGFVRDVQAVLGRSDPNFVSQIRRGDVAQLSEGQQLRNELQSIRQAQEEQFRREDLPELLREYGLDEFEERGSFFSDRRLRASQDINVQGEQVLETIAAIWESDIGLYSSVLATFSEAGKFATLSMEAVSNAALAASEQVLEFTGIFPEWLAIIRDNVRDPVDPNTAQGPQSPREIERRREQTLGLLSQLPGGERYRLELQQPILEEQLFSQLDAGNITGAQIEELLSNFEERLADAQNPFRRQNQAADFNAQNASVLDRRQALENNLRFQGVQAALRQQGINQGQIDEFVEGQLGVFDAQRGVRAAARDRQVGYLDEQAFAATQGPAALRRARFSAQAREIGLTGEESASGAFSRLERTQEAQSRIGGEVQLFQLSEQADQVRDLTGAVREGSAAMEELRFQFEAAQAVQEGSISAIQEGALVVERQTLAFEGQLLNLTQSTEALEKNIDNEARIVEAMKEGTIAVEEQVLQNELLIAQRELLSRAQTPAQQEAAANELERFEVARREQQGLQDERTFTQRQEGGERQLTAMRQRLELMTLTTDAAAEQQFIFEEMNALEAAGVPITEERLAAIQAQASAYGDLQQQIRLTQQFSRGFASAITDGFRAASEEAGSFKEILNEVGKRLLDITKELLIFSPLEDALGALFASGAQAAGGYATGGGGAGGLLASLFASGAAGGAGGGAAQPGGQATAQSPATATAAGAAGAAAPGLFGSILGFFGFESGGIMTANGPVPLRSYNAGGVANSPQLALFGEGSKPEAYVPLPDGKSIPVTMQGGGSGITQNNNITISSNSPEGAGGTSENPGLDPEMLSQLERQITQTVRQATVQEMREQSRPRGALRSSY